MHRKEDIRKKVQITRNKYTKEAILNVYYTGKWSLFANSSTDFDTIAEPIMKNKGEGNFTLNINNSERTYFLFKTETEKFIFAEKLIPVEGGYNFRDLGGIRSKNGKHVKWGKLFRADDMSHLTESDLTYLASIPITSVIDFRAPSECKRSPDKLPHTARFTYPIAITPGNLSTEGIQANLLNKNINIHMKQMNRLLVSDPACVRAYRILFAIIQNNLSAPIVFHCSAGKDRTGMAAALILFALGVDEETIINDYLMSKDFLTDKYAAFIAKYPHTEPLFTVKRIYIKAAINQIKREHGSINNFLTKVLKVDIPKMKWLYLE